MARPLWPLAVLLLFPAFSSASDCPVTSWTRFKNGWIGPIPTKFGLPSEYMSLVQLYYKVDDEAKWKATSVEQKCAWYKEYETLSARIEGDQKKREAILAEVDGAKGKQRLAAIKSHDAEAKQISEEIKPDAEKYGAMGYVGSRDYLIEFPDELKKLRSDTRSKQEGQSIAKADAAITSSQATGSLASAATIKKAAGAKPQDLQKASNEIFDANSRQDLAASDAPKRKHKPVQLASTSGAQTGGTMVTRPSAYEGVKEEPAPPPLPKEEKGFFGKVLDFLKSPVGIGLIAGVAGAVLLGPIVGGGLMGAGVGLVTFGAAGFMVGSLFSKPGQHTVYYTSLKGQAMMNDSAKVTCGPCPAGHYRGACAVEEGNDYILGDNCTTKH